VEAAGRLLDPHPASAADGDQCCRASVLLDLVFNGISVFDLLLGIDRTLPRVLDVVLVAA